MGISPEVRFGTVVRAVSVVAGDTENCSVYDLIIDPTDEREILGVGGLKPQLMTADNPTTRTKASRIQAVDDLCLIVERADFAE